MLFCFISVWSFKYIYSLRNIVQFILMEFSLLIKSCDLRKKILGIRISKTEFEPLPNLPSLSGIKPLSLIYFELHQWDNWFLKITPERTSHIILILKQNYKRIFISKKKSLWGLLKLEWLIKSLLKLHYVCKQEINFCASLNDQL